VLLDALEAIGTHRDAVVLVGAQAIYLRVGDAHLAVAPFTTDGDLAIEPALLADIPPLEKALAAAGFFPKTHDSVGVWITHRKTSLSVKTEVAVDLLVPRAVSPGTGRRSARLPGHDSRAARLVAGLEGALVDSDIMPLCALETADSRSFNIRVAGPAALLVAKVHKISERHGSERQVDKDALDIVRLLRGTTTEDLAARYRRLLADERSKSTAASGLTMFQDAFARKSSVGIEMAVRSAGSLVDPAELTTSCELLANDLLTLLRGS